MARVGHVAAVAMGLVLLSAACGGSEPTDEERFCDIIRFEVDEVGDPMRAATPDEARRIVSETAGLFEEWAELAPEEIKAEVRVVVDAFQFQVDVYERAGYDASRVDTADLVSAVGQTMTGDIGEANDVVTDYLVSNCLPESFRNR